MVLPSSRLVSCADGRQIFELEHFRAKWKPVRVKEMRPNNNLERFLDSIKLGTALVRIRGQARQKPGLSFLHNLSNPAIADKSPAPVALRPFAR